jgi:hypothetical protein
VGGSGEGVLSHHALHLVDHTASNAVLVDDDVRITVRDLIVLIALWIIAAVPVRCR